jgi:aminoglycoside/choline kinase family phosphotransferase/dTDP-glucose pyrophosphorylase
VKAFILAAGMGTRLKPYSDHTPKPLFPVMGRPLIDRIICQLQDAGFTDIAINLHHLAGQIEAFVNRQAYRARIHLVHEPQILGTGGGIKNLGDFWRSAPLLVINSDILTDIDLKAVYDDHAANGCQATLVMHDRPEFNTVAVGPDGSIVSFSSRRKCPPETVLQAFTGIQVINPTFIDFTPDKQVFSSIAVYREMIKAGKRVRAYRVRNHFWEDLGTPQRYLDTVSRLMAAEAFCVAHNRRPEVAPVFTALQGDGSDRRWYRVSSGTDTLVAVSHGIRPVSDVCEADAFINIGRHLHSRGLPVPRLYAADAFSGFAFLEDLGNRHLQDAVQSLTSSAARFALYRRVIDKLVALSDQGARGFDTAWTYQSDAYDRQTILENECAYFVRAFLQLKRGLDTPFASLEDEFDLLAEKTLAHGINGFMHRDFQSRNIMLRGDDCYFIDFQGGRIGPVQYDLASLLIDPYVELAPELQAELCGYAQARVCAATGAEATTFLRGYRYCVLTRNLQILGAFGHLSRQKGKSAFANYIPAAVASLKRALASREGRAFPKLRAVVEQL